MKIMESQLLVKRISLVLVILILSPARSQQDDISELGACDLEALVRQLTNPSDEYALHAAALRSQLRDLLENRITNSYYADDDDSDEMNAEKRNVASLARAGALQNIKRSLATLAKNGQLPSQQPDADAPSSLQFKRNLASIVRSGKMGGKRNIGSIVRDRTWPQGKRNLQSIVREGLMPPHGPPKRNVASLARSNWYPYLAEKRNVGALARDWTLRHTKMTENPDDIRKSDGNEKRNIGSFKNSLGGNENNGGSGRKKRSPTFPLSDDIGFNSIELSEPVMQNMASDYDELQELMSEMYPYNVAEKRFLGRILPPTRSTTTTNRRRL